MSNEDYLYLAIERVKEVETGISFTLPQLFTLNEWHNLSNPIGLGKEFKSVMEATLYFKVKVKPQLSSGTQEYIKL